MLGEEFDGLVDGHLKDVVDIFAFVSYFEDIALESFAVAGFAFQYEVGHELHFYGHGSFAFTFFAASSFGVEREESGCEAHLFGQGLVGK